MKKYILFFVAIVISLSMSAKKICIWREGAKVCELSIYANDSITFASDNPSAQKMCIWRNGVKLQELGIQESDSITYSIVPQFDYDNWRDQTTIQLYYDHTWNAIKLPWADVAVTTMPKAYRFPNREFTHDTVPKWELAFELCSDSTLQGVHMFGLWDWKSQTMRVYAYLEDQPNPSAKYCFYETTTTHALSVERDAMGWMPSDSIKKLHNWDASKLPAGASAPSDLWCQIMPIAGTLDGQVNRGWLCFEMNLSAGKSNLPKDGTINFAMYAVENLDITAAINLNVSLQSKNGQIVAPGNKQRKASGFWDMTGGFLGGLASAFTQAVSVGLSDGFGDWTHLAGWGVGIAGGLGSLLSGVGAGISAADEGDSTKYSLKLDFNGTVDGEFKGQLTTTTGTNVSPVSMYFDKFFGNILTHTPSQAPHVRKAAHDSISVGLWNLNRQPVLYVCRDAYNIISGPAGESLITFLDPTSIDVVINKTSQLFDTNSIDSITVVPYTFAFVNENYTMSAEPYYGFYNISRDSLPETNAMKEIFGLDNTSYLLTPDSAYYNSFTKGYYTYSGISSGFLSEYGLDEYNMVYSPAIILNNWDYFQTHKQTLNDISVGVVMEIKFKNGERRVFSERFLPEVKSFTMAEAQSMFERIYATAAPTTIDGYAAEFPLFEKQKAKALRMLNDAAHPLELYLSDMGLPVGGMLIHPYQNESNPGLVIVTSQMDLGHLYSCEQLAQLFGDLETIVHGDWKLYDERLKHIVTLTPMAGKHIATSDPTQDYVIGTGCVPASEEKIYIAKYMFNSLGKLVLIQE